MKNIYLLIFILIFLYFICNRCIEKFSVGCQISEQGNEQDNDNKISISSKLFIKNMCKAKISDNCNADSDCQSNNCYNLKCAQPKCDTSSDCDNGKICWGTGDTKVCDPTMICEEYAIVGSRYVEIFCDNDPTCIWNNENNICEKYNPGWTNFGFYDCNQGECIKSKPRKGNYKYLKDCEQSCKSNYS